MSRTLQEIEDRYSEARQEGPRAFRTDSDCFQTDCGVVCKGILCDEHYQEFKRSRSIRDRRTCQVAICTIVMEGKAKFCPKHREENRVQRRDENRVANPMPTCDTCGRELSSRRADRCRMCAKINTGFNSRPSDMRAPDGLVVMVEVSTICPNRGGLGHHWILDAPNGPTGMARCKVCPAEREMPNTLPESANWGDQFVIAEPVVTVSTKADFHTLSV